ncbi:MAG: hypothetical protein AAF694_29695 [Bacteroidota bacterium]
MKMEFNDAVKEIALPELSSFGFIIKEESKGYIKFFSTNLAISFIYDYSRTEASGVNISLVENKDYNFNTLTYYEFLTIKKKEEPKLNVLGEGHCKWIKWNLALLKLDGALLLKGNKFYFFEVYEFLLKKSHNYTENIRLRTLIREIDQAWQKRDYPQIVELIKDDYDNLSPAYQKKYEYALKKVL